MPSRIKRQAVIGLDLGGTNLRVAGVTREGRVLTLHREETKATNGPGNLVKRIVDGIACVEDRLKSSRQEVVGVSLGVPGVISRHEGVVESSPNLPGWNRIPLLEYLQERVSLPLLLENDANAAVYGEYWAGAGKGRRTIVLITLGTGVGGGIIINGQLLRGADGMAGEIGHLTVEREGLPCPCGNRGCLERYASATGISRRYRLLREKRSRGEGPDADRGPGTEEVHRLAQSGDALAVQALREAGTYLGIAMAAIVNIINPEVIIIGGGVLPAWDFFMPSAMQEMLARAFQAPAESVEMLPASLGDEAGFIGAAGLFWEEFPVNGP